MIIVCTPVYRGECDLSADTRATVRALRDAGIARPEWVLQPGPLVFDNRNKAIAAALKIGEWSHVLFLDADIALPNAIADVRGMLARAQDIACGPYTMRCDVGPGRMCAARYDAGHVAPGASGLHAVDWAGGGCMLISRAAVDALGPLWFRHEFVDEPPWQTPEDVGFCRWARSKGYKIWLDCDVTVTHLLNHREGSMSEGKSMQMGRVIPAQPRGPSLMEVINNGYRSMQDTGAVLRLLEREIDRLSSEVKRLTTENDALRKQPQLPEQEKAQE